MLKPQTVFHSLLTGYFVLHFFKNLVQLLNSTEYIHKSEKDELTSAIFQPLKKAHKTKKLFLSLVELLALRRGDAPVGQPRRVSVRVGCFD